MKLKHFVTISFFVLGAFLISKLIAQVSAPTAKIKLDFVTEHKIGENPALKPTGTSSGLNNVGIGETVYLIGSGSGTNLTYNWSIKSPTGSSASLSKTNKDSTYFQPDSMGIYTITLTITASNGTAKDSIKVNAGKFLSVGEIGGLTATFPQCGLGCHQDVYDKWIKTAHSSAFARKIDDPASHFSGNCLECHTLGYNTISSAVNDGFDDVASKLGWTFPTEIKAGNWQNMINNYPTLAQHANVQCENCHGPGSGHTLKFRRGPIEVSGIGKGFEPGICARCHDAPPYHVYYPEWKISGHSTEASSQNRSGCSICHTGKGFVEESIRGKAFAGPYTEGLTIVCAACHDPHDVGNPKQLRKIADYTLLDGTVVKEGGAGKLCMNCHHSRRNAETYVTQYSSNFGPHHSNQADMFVGTNAVEFGMDMPRTGHFLAIENSCVTCHMRDQESADPGWQKIGEHTFNMKYVSGTDTLYNVKTCQGCHGNQIKKFDDIKAAADYDGDGTVEGAISEIKGLMEQLGMLLPPVGKPEVVVTNKYTLTQLKASYNYIFVQEDRSNGIHNTSYAASILKSAIQALMTGDIGASTILSITDVPNDQGKQVRVRWNRFPGDGISNNPVIKYGIWRRIDDKTLSKNAIAVSTYEEMFNNIENISNGNKFVVNETGELWDFVKDVPATGESQYSTITATLFDSTKAQGMRWSVFYISGHSSSGGLVVKSAIDSGYSIDNLAPNAPTPKMATKTSEKVTIEWSDPVDDDFNYFQVYRGTKEYFDASVTKPVARLVETKFIENLSTVNEKYFYKITAVDFNGNESPYSLEISEDNIITSIGDDNSKNLPNVFRLDQNYPNPFNPTTHISYQLPKSVYVNLTIYNVLGVKIRTLVNEWKSTGFYEVEWDGKDESGNGVSSGIYIYRINAGKYSESKKMAFMK